MIQKINDIIIKLKEGGYTDKEIEEIVMHLSCGRSLDAALQWDM